MYHNIFIILYYICTDVSKYPYPISIHAHDLQLMAILEDRVGIHFGHSCPPLTCDAFRRPESPGRLQHPGLRGVGDEEAAVVVEVGGLGAGSSLAVLLQQSRDHIQGFPGSLPSLQAQSGDTPMWELGPISRWLLDHIQFAFYQQYVLFLTTKMFPSLTDDNMGMLSDLDKYFQCFSNYIKSIYIQAVLLYCTQIMDLFSTTVSSVDTSIYY